MIAGRPGSISGGSAAIRAAIWSECASCDCIDRLAQPGDAAGVREQLGDGDLILPGHPELGPDLGHPGARFEQPSLDQPSSSVATTPFDPEKMTAAVSRCHGRPGSVRGPAPQVDDGQPVHDRRQRAPAVTTLRQVPLERIAHPVEPRGDRPLDGRPARTHDCTASSDGVSDSSRFV